MLFGLLPLEMGSVWFFDLLVRHLSLYWVVLFRLMIWDLPGLIVACYAMFGGYSWNVCNFLSGDRTGCICGRQKYGWERRVTRNFNWVVLYEKTIKNLKKYCNMIGRVSLLANSKLWLYWYWMRDEKNIITFGKVSRGSFITFFTLEWHTYVCIDSTVWTYSAIMKQNKDFLKGPKEVRGT